MSPSVRFWLLFFLFVQQTAYLQDSVAAQLSSPTDLLNVQEPLNLALRFSIDQLKEETNDSTHLDGMLYYGAHGALSDSIPVRARARGLSRRKNCYTRQ